MLKEKLKERQSCWEKSGENEKQKLLEMGRFFLILSNGEIIIIKNEEIKSYLKYSHLSED